MVAIGQCDLCARAMGMASIRCMRKGQLRFHGYDAFEESGL